MSKYQIGNSKKIVEYKLIIFYIFFFLFFFVFFSSVHPLYIFDTDDWTNMGIGRSVLPQISSFNPIKIFPEVLFPLAALFPARIIYPLTGDYISSLCIGFAFIYSSVILCSAICLHRFFSKIRIIFFAHKQDDPFFIIFLVVIFFLYLFYFGRNGNYLLREVNVTCIFHYSIPAIFNFSVVLLLICFEKSNRQILCFENPYLNVFWALAIYLCIFSNLFISSVLISYVIFFLLRQLITELKLSRSFLSCFLKYFFLHNYQYIVLLLIWILSAYLESQGGRAGMIGRQNDFTVLNISNSVKYFFKDTVYSVAFGKISIVGLFLFVSANSLLIVRYIKNILSDLDKKFFLIQLFFLWMVLFIILYHIMLTVKTGVGYQSRPSLVFCWVAWVLLELACAYIYIYSFCPRINTLLPIVVLVLFYRVTIHNSVFCETNFVPYSNINTVKEFGNDLINIIENADRSGEKEVKLYVPKFDSQDNWPIAIYAGYRIADTLYLQGITKRLLKISIIADENVNTQYPFQ